MMMQSNNSPDLDALTRAGLDTARFLFKAWEDFARNLGDTNALLGLQRSSCCDIPPPCWLPRNFGSYASRACPCGSALLRVRVTNCQPTSSTVSLRVDDGSGLAIKITPDSATLAPMERKWFTVAVTIPDDACPGHDYDLLVRAAGCNDHYARWSVRVADGTSGSCVQAELEDGPDYVHHWYDHFHCRRPCMSRQDNDQDNDQANKSGRRRQS